MNKYNPQDFSLDSYQELLLIAKEKFIFRNFSDFSKNEPFILWRHDIDFSVEKALALARIENELGIKATYFIHLHSLFYNPLEKQASLMIKEIVSLGHALGLHFDCEYYDLTTAQQLENHLTLEQEILEKTYNTPVSVFSYHNTTPASLSLNSNTYAGMVNTYSYYFQNNLEYCSDSNGYWRFRRLQDVICDDSVTQLHVLTHPEWWVDGNMMPREKIVHLLDCNQKKMIQYYDSALTTFARENIGKE